MTGSGSASAGSVTVGVRRAGPSDASALARLRYEFRASLKPAAEDEPSFVARCETWMAPRLGGDSAWAAWVAERRAAIVGTVWMEFFEKMPNPVAEAEAHGYLTNFYVRDGERGAGTGSRLLEVALAECERRRVHQVLLWPTDRSRPLYERFGFGVRDDHMARVVVAPRAPLH